MEIFRDSVIVLIAILVPYFLFISPSGYKTGEVVFVNELTGDDLIPIIEGSDIYVTVKPSSNDTNIKAYKFNIKDEDGKTKEIEVIGNSDDKLPQDKIQYYETNSVEPSIMVESVDIYHHVRSTKKEYLYTIFMPK